MGKRFDMSCPRPKQNGGTFWHRIGSAFENDEGQITLYFDSLPLADENGKVRAMLFEPRERSEAPARGAAPARGTTAKRQDPPRQQSTLAEDLDDEIPF